MFILNTWMCADVIMEESVLSSPIMATEWLIWCSVKLFRFNRRLLKPHLGARATCGHRGVSDGARPGRQRCWFSFSWSGPSSLLAKPGQLWLLVGLSYVEMPVPPLTEAARRH